VASGFFLPLSKDSGGESSAEEETKPGKGFWDGYLRFKEIAGETWSIQEGWGYGTVLYKPFNLYKSEHTYRKEGFTCGKKTAQDTPRKVPLVKGKDCFIVKGGGVKDIGFVRGGSEEKVSKKGKKKKRFKFKEEKFCKSLLFPGKLR